MEGRSTDADAEEYENAEQDAVRLYCERFGRQQKLQPFFMGPPIKQVLPSSSKQITDVKHTDDPLNILKPCKTLKYKEEKIPSSPETARHTEDLNSLDISSTSRQCEWDSFADVGYENANKKIENELSTLEKMALSKHYKVENEKSCNPDPIPEKYTIGLPEAQSTPNQISVSFKTKKLKKSFEHRKKSNKLKLQIDQPKPTVENFNIDLAKHYSINIGSAGHSNSPPVVQISDPQSHSENESNLVTKKTETTEKSVEVNFPVREEPEIPIITKQNVAISAQGSLEFKKPNVPVFNPSVPSTSNSGPFIFNLFAPVTKKKTFISKKESWSSPYEYRGRYSSKSQSTESNEDDAPPEISPSTVCNSTPNKFGESLLSRADSFEYISGHLYKNNEKLDSPRYSDEKKISESPRIGSDTHSSCSRESLESYVELVNALVNKRHSDPKKKKELGNKIVNLIMGSSPPEPACKRGIDFTSASINMEEKIVPEFNSQYYNVVNECLNVKDSFYLDLGGDKHLNKKYFIKQPFRSCASEPTPNNKLTEHLNETNITVSAPASLLLNDDEPIYQDVNSCKSTCGSVVTQPEELIEYSSEKTSESVHTNSSSENTKKPLCLNAEINVNLHQEADKLKPETSSSNFSPKKIYMNLNLINQKISELNSLMKKHIKEKEQKPSEHVWNSLPTQKLKHESPKDKFMHRKQSAKISNTGNIDIPPLNLNNSSEDWTDNNNCERKQKNISVSDNVTSSQIEESVDGKETLSSLSIKSLPPSSEQSHLNSAVSKSSNEKISKSLSISNEISRAEKLLSKYEKCKTMKAFMKDYEDLILKYHQMKVYKAKSKKSSDSDSSNLKSVNNHSIDEIEKKSIERKRNLENKICQTDLSKNDVATSPLIISPKISARTKSSTKTSPKKSESRQSTYKSPVDIRESNNESRTNNTKTKSSRDFENRLRKFFDKEFIRLVNEYKSSPKKNTSNKLVEENSDASKITSKCLDVTNSSLKTDPTISHKITSSKENIKMSEKIPSNKIVTEEKSSKNKVSCNCKEINVSCKSCRKKFIKLFLKKKVEEQQIKNREYPKPIAYNLVVYQSNSICQEKEVEKKKLDDVVIKVPKFKRKPEQGNKINFEYVKNIPEIIVSEDGDEKRSTDEQLKELSSLNSDSLKIDKDKSNTKAKSEILLSVSEYLQMNRPKFLNNANKRWNMIKQQHTIRECNNMIIREIIRLGLTNLPCSKHISETDLQNIARMYGIEILKGGKVFNSKTIVRNTTKMYKTLPEVQQKKDNIKKEQKKKENLLLVDLFSKKLQQKALKGIVNTSHTARILSL